jgi:hypothetical protein
MSPRTALRLIPGLSREKSAARWRSDQRAAEYRFGVHGDSGSGRRRRRIDLHPTFWQPEGQRFIRIKPSIIQNFVTPNVAEKA